MAQTLIFPASKGPSNAVRIHHSLVFLFIYSHPTGAARNAPSHFAVINMHFPLYSIAALCHFRLNKNLVLELEDLSLAAVGRRTNDTLTEHSYYLS